MDNGGDHRGATDCRRPAAQGRYVVNNASCSTCDRPPDADLLRPRRVSSVDGRTESRRLADVHQTRAFVVQVVADRRRRRDDVDSAALPPGAVYDRHHSLSRAISALQKKRKSVVDSWISCMLFSIRCKS